MPKEMINYPQPVTVHSASEDEILPPGPQVALHWDARHGTVQLSIDIDLDVLERIVRGRRDHPEMSDGSPEGRQLIYTESLDRADLQRLVKHARRARDAAFGADE